MIVNQKRKTNKYFKIIIYKYFKIIHFYYSFLDKFYLFLNHKENIFYII